MKQAHARNLHMFVEETKEFVGDVALMYATGEIGGFVLKPVVGYIGKGVSTLVTEGAAKASTTIIPRTVGAASKGFSKVLQTGGHTLNNSTLKALGLTKEQGKFAIEALKRAERLPNNFHGKIMGNGDFLHPQTGEWIGNLFDYVH